MRMLILAATLFVSLATLSVAADPTEAFRPWSAFDKLDVAELSAGKIATAANASMKSERGISAQAAYVVQGSVDSVRQALLTFDPSKHAGLDSLQHHLFRGEQDAAFDRLQLDPRISAVSALIKAIRERKGLQLSQGEAIRLPGSPSSEAAQQFLAGNLRQRWAQFIQSGNLGSSGGHDSRTEIRSLLAEEPKIAAHFARLLVPLTSQGDAIAPRYHYWDLANVNKTAAVDLGAIYSMDAGERRQVLDVVYYASSGYLVAVTLYELVPFSIGARNRTLIWQGTLVSSTEIPGGFGLKRKIAARMIVSDLEKWIRVLQREAAKLNP